VEKLKHHNGLSIEDWKTIADCVSGFATAAAVLAGGLWAYFKFIKGRTFRPRLAVKLAGEWRRLGDADVLLVRVTVANIGGAKMALNQWGSGLETFFPTDDREDGTVTWEQNGGLFKVLKEHQWIEPGETVFDEVLLDPGRSPTICKLQVNLLWAPSDRHHGTPEHPKYSERDIEIFACRILPIDAKITDTVASQSRNGRTGEGEAVNGK
jgi:hypothetical protein